MLGPQQNLTIVDSFKSNVEVTRGNLVVPGNSIMGLP